MTGRLRALAYFGLIDGSLPGVAGGGTTGILSLEGGGVRLIPGST
jgi:hypothetical protein